MSRYIEFFSVGLSDAETIGLPGLFFLCILGRRWNRGFYGI